MTNPVLGWAASFGGAGLLYAAVRNRNPLDMLTSGLSGAALTPRSITTNAGVGAGGGTGAGASTPSTSTPSAGGGGGYGARVAAGAATGTPPPAPQLVAIGYGSHRLAPGAAAAYAAASARFGRPIPVTDSYRSWQQQADAHARDPRRFASPAGSYHVKGQAIDVDHTKVPGGVNDPRMVEALTAAGWQRYDPTGEPWHWSWGGRG